MQTFLPYADYTQTMRCLDAKRLGNQVWREGLTLLRGGWPNHPAAKMWRGYKYSLGEYLLAGLDELSRRGKDYPVIREKILCAMRELPQSGKPLWLGDAGFHASHRSNLLRKNFTWYSQFGWTEPNDLPYVWPVR